MKKPRIYISGPMTGLPKHNFPAFHKAAKAWRKAGWDVENPAEAFDGRTDLRYLDYARRDVEVLRTCSAIAMLPGWDAPTARGSIWEHEIATQMLRLPVFDATEPAKMTTFALPSIGVVVPRTVLPSDAAARKAVPIVSGVLDYFPAALAEVARVSKVGNDQHNPGQPMHHARGKSSDHADCAVRHLFERGAIDTDDLRHTAKAAWRVLALLQEELEQQAGAPLPRGARLAEEIPK